MVISIYRGGSIVLTLNGAKTYEQGCKVMDYNAVSLVFEYYQAFTFQIGDYVTVGSDNYYLNTLPRVEKTANNKYNYSCTFESLLYDLGKTQYMLFGEGEFPLTGNADTFIDLIVSNLNRTGSGWTKGTVISNTEYKTLSFANENCLSVLQKLAGEENYNTEFYLVSKQINFTSFGTNNGLTFKYGQNLGLYSIVRETVSSKNICTRLYSFGSEKNIPSTYRGGARRLRFMTWRGASTPTLVNAPASSWTTDALKNQHLNDYYHNTADTKSYRFNLTGSTYSWVEITDSALKALIAASPGGGVNYYDQNTSTYGTIEFSKNFDDVYPHRTGTISAVNGSDITKFADSSIDFDVNSYLISGVTAKLNFKTGDLAGYEFEILAFNNSTKEFTLKYFDNGVAGQLPTSILRPAVGNKYVLLDISMPQSYIDTAEAALLAAATTYLGQNSSPRVQYAVDCDPLYFKNNNISLNVGDSSTITDDGIPVNKLIRIVSFIIDLIHGFNYKLTLSDSLEKSNYKRAYAQAIENNRIIYESGIGDITQQRRNRKTTEELRTMTFDADGYFDGGNIRPNSIETNMLAVGSKGGDFVLSGILIEPNYTGDKSKVNVGSGTLVHFSIADTVTTWNITGATTTGLTDGTAYYIYAKCTRSTSSATIVFDSTQRKVDSDATYYYFIIGVLHSVVDGVRGISLTYGQTAINGKFIKTGKVQSVNGAVYFDLENEIINLSNAGLSGVGSSSSDIRFWAGATYEDRATAPFKILQNGTVIISTNNGYLVIDSDTFRLMYTSKSYVIIDRDNSHDYGLIKLLDQDQVRYLRLSPIGISYKSNNGGSHISFDDSCVNINQPMKMVDGTITDYTGDAAFSISAANVALSKRIKLKVITTDVTAESSPVQGEIIFSTYAGGNKAYCYDGSTWRGLW